MDKEQVWANGFLVGAIAGILIAMTGSYITRPDISNEDFYRFCMVKNIPLQNCKTPKKPYKVEMGDGVRG